MSEGRGPTSSPNCYCIMSHMGCKKQEPSHLKCPHTRKIPKMSRGGNIFERPFLRGLFLEGFIFGGAYLQREICVSKSIGLAL